MDEVARIITFWIALYGAACIVLHHERGASNWAPALGCPECRAVRRGKPHSGDVCHGCGLYIGHHDWNRAARRWSGPYLFPWIGVWQVKTYAPESKGKPPVGGSVLNEKPVPPPNQLRDEHGRRAG